MSADYPDIFLLLAFWTLLIIGCLGALFAVLTVAAIVISNIEGPTDDERQ